MQKILLFNIKDEKLKKIMQIASVKRVKVEMVEKELYGNTILDIYQNNCSSKTTFNDDFLDEMMVFCSINEDSFNYILKTMRKEKVSVLLKAVMTETNKQWNAKQLSEELNKERIAYENRLQGKNI